MKIKNIQYYKKNKKAILSGDVVLESGKTHNLYFEVDEEFGDFIAKDASPFLAACLPLSMKKKENLKIEGSISKSLMGNSSRIMNIISNSNLGFNQISIQADSLKEDSKMSKNIGGFFSGGVDSFYTYLKNKSKINHLIFVHGFDVDVNNLALYNKLEKNIIKIANKENKKLIRVKTNIRETFDHYLNWEMYHIFAILSIGLFLRNGFKEIYESCGLPIKNGKHHYISPKLDALWASENMRFIHYGCDADKIIKIRYLSNYKLVLENLKVCWVNKNNAYNCSECEKCFRNMLALYICNSLGKSKTFAHTLNLDKLKNIRASEYCLKYFLALLEVMKLNNDKSDIRLALEECIKNNQTPSLKERVKRRIRDSIRFLDEKYNRNRFYWYLAHKGLVS